MDTSEWIGIGAFGQLSGLTVETLRHYHQAGLLPPAEVDDRTGYRRYRMSQLPTARSLAALREVGMPLDQVADLIVLTDPSARRSQLLAHRQRLIELSRRADARVAAMDRMIEREHNMSAASLLVGGPSGVSEERIRRELAGALARTDADHLGTRYEGKVRDSYVDGEIRTIVTTDRLSAFDRVLGTIPFKGQVLNTVANFWFDAVSDIVANHLVEIVDPNVVRVRDCTPIPLEFVVRGYLTGVSDTSLWRNYAAGTREFADTVLPDTLRRNQRIDEPILTPTTKLEEHDRNISRSEAVAMGLISAEVYDRCAELCLRLFTRGTEIAAERGLILVDTKYELGMTGDQIVLIDEVHTPDSSRYWYADSYEELFRADQDQRALDKEPLREWLADHGFRGDGPAPTLTDEVRVATAVRYIVLAEELTQRPFELRDSSAAERVGALLART